MIRKASVHWKGGVKGGTRMLTTESGVLKQAGSSLGLVQQLDAHTDPAELIAAAHASSFSFALSNELGTAGLARGEIITTATATLESGATGWSIIDMHLNIVGRRLKVTQDKLIDAAIRAKTKCLVSRLLRADISVNAKLEP